MISAKNGERRLEDASETHIPWLSRSNSAANVYHHSQSSRPQRIILVLTEPQIANMITKYLTSVTTSFSPFNARSGKTARNFLALLPPNSRSTMAIDIKTLGKEGARVPAMLGLKFSMYMAQGRGAVCICGLM